MLLDYKYIAALAIRAQNNDSIAFTELYALTHQKEYAFACNYLKDPVLAQDAIQETYIRAYKNISQLKDTSRFVSWLHSINFRVCYTMLEKKKNTKENLGEESYRDIIDPNPSNNPELRTLAKNESSAMKTYLERPPLKVRQVVIMRYINEMNLEDISEAMHCSLSSVKRYLVKARKIMRDYLKERKL